MAPQSAQAGASRSRTKVTLASEEAGFLKTSLISSGSFKASEIGLALEAGAGAGGGSTSRLMIPTAA